MGVGIYPAFNRPVDEAAFDCEGKALARSFEALDAEMGLPGLSSFGDTRSIPEDFDGDPNELDEVVGPWDEWFPIADGLRTIDGLIAAVSRLP